MARKTPTAIDLDELPRPGDEPSTEDATLSPDGELRTPRDAVPGRADATLSPEGDFPSLNDDPPGAEEDATLSPEGARPGDDLRWTENDLPSPEDVTTSPDDPASPEGLSTEPDDLPSLEEESPAAEDADPPQRAGGGRHRRSAPQRRSWAARPRLLGVLALAVAVVAGGVALLVPAASARLNGDRPPNPAQGGGATGAPRTEPTPTWVAPPAPQVYTLAAGQVNVEFDGFLSWALIDRAGKTWGSANLAAPTSAESLVRVWIVSDYLRRVANLGKTPSAARLAQARRAILNGDDRATQALYAAGGGTAQIRRMITTCRLSDTTIDRSWSRTRISARDGARLGACVADGRAAGPKWTSWVQTEMTKVYGTKGGQSRDGRWGIVDGLPEQVTARGVGIQNGWSAKPVRDEWHVNCLAVGADWALAVLTRSPESRGLSYGLDACSKAASQLVAQPVPAT